MRNPEQHCDDSRMPAIVAEVKDDIGRHQARERLQVLEAWKLDAGEIELSLIGALEDFYRDSLDEDRDDEADDDFDPRWDEDYRLDSPQHGQADSINAENRRRR